MTALRLLKQDFVALLGATERLDSIILTQVDALHHARDLQKTFMSIIAAIGKKDTQAFGVLNTNIPINIEDYRKRVVALRTFYKITNAGREAA